MKVISNEFKEKLKEVKEVSVVLSYAGDGVDYILTQNSDFVLTEDEDFITTQGRMVVVENDNIKALQLSWDTDLLKSVCKMIELETTNNIPKNTELKLKVGIKVNGEYEYVNYGKFYTLNDAEYNMDTETYSTVAYDSMIKFNILANENKITFTPGSVMTLEQYLKKICEKCGVSYKFSYNLSADEPIIDKDYYDGINNITYRDIINDIAQCICTNFMINEKNEIVNKDVISISRITIDDDNLQDTGVTIGEAKQPITGVAVYDNNTLINIEGTDTSLYKINDNVLMSAFSDTFIEYIYTHIGDKTYYTYDIQTYGLLAVEPFDFYTLNHKNKNYLLCSLNHQIDLSSGLTETISYSYSDVDSTTEYTTANESSNLKDAYIQINKANSQIVLKVKDDGSLAQVELGANASEGSSFNVKADNINLEGYTTINGNFKIDTQGNMECNNAKVSGQINSESGKIGGWTILGNGLSNNQGFYVRDDGVCNIYVLGDIMTLRLMLQTDTLPAPGTIEFKHFDLNNDGVIDSSDLLLLRQLFGVTE